MPCAVTVDADTGVVVVTVEGRLTIEDTRSAIQEIWRTPEYLEHFRVLWDFRHTGISHFSTDDLREVAAFQQKERSELPRSRIALLVSKEVDFGLMRMLGAFLPEADLENDVFRDAESAWSWLRARDVRRLPR